MIRVAYPGGAAAHSAAAAERLFPGERELVSLETFSDVVDAAGSGGVAYGVLPIENSLVGPVAETHDLLYDAQLSIVAETSIPIHACGPPSSGGVAERISPERPLPQPMSRMREGPGRSRSSRARWVMEAWMFWIRDEVVYLRASTSS